MGQCINTNTDDVTDEKIRNNTNDFTLCWYHICNRVSHELYDNLSSGIKSIIDNNDNININDEINNESLNEILKQLTENKKLNKPQIEYIQQLINRSKQFALNQVITNPTNIDEQS